MCRRNQQSSISYLDRGLGFTTESPFVYDTNCTVFEQVNVGYVRLLVVGHCPDEDPVGLNRLLLYPTRTVKTFAFVLGRQSEGCRNNHCFIKKQVGKLVVAPTPSFSRSVKL